MLNIVPGEENVLKNRELRVNQNGSSDNSEISKPEPAKPIKFGGWEGKISMSDDLI